MANEKKVTQVDLEDFPTLEDNSEVNVLAKDFPYPQFMDKELMTPSYLKQLRGDEDSLVDKFQ